MVESNLKNGMVYRGWIGDGWKEVGLGIVKKGKDWVWLKRGWIGDSWKGDELGIVEKGI